MAIRAILKYPHPTLTMTCDVVTDFDASLASLAIDLLDTLRHSSRPGVGLAANQIGDTRRLFVVSMQPGRMPFDVFVNPHIHKRRGDDLAIEGCLSLTPSDDRQVKRSKIINWSAQSIHGFHIRGKLSGFEARVFQHELDHLNGILINRKAAQL